MPTSSIAIHAQELADVLCMCFSALDITDCECFVGKNEDLCCNPIFGWGGGIDIDCAGVFVNFIGSQVDDRTDSNCGPLFHVGEFQVGVALCPPDLSTSRSASKGLATYSNYVSCMEFLSSEAWKCLTALRCCDNQNAVVGDVVSVTGIDIEDDRFAITLGVIL